MNMHPFPAKLSMEQAEEIRLRYGKSESPSQLANEYGIALSSLYSVLRGRTHQRRVTVTLSSEDVQQLERFATAQQWSRETAAQELIRRGFIFVR